VTGRLPRRGRALLAFTLLLGCVRPEPYHPNLVIVRARDFAFEAPDTVPAGLTAIRMLNAGPSTHHVQLMRLPDSLSPEDAMAALPPQEPLPAVLLPSGGPEGADDPDRVNTALVVLHPGHYLLVCRFAAEDGRLHYRLGMVRPLTVVGPPAQLPARLPPVRDTITLQDFSFSGPDSVPAGADSFVVVNHGPSEHHVAIARLLPGKTLSDALHEFSESGAPSATEILGGVAGLGVGEANLLPIRLAPGAYVLLCLVPDPVSGREHVALGMIRRLTVHAPAR